MAHETDIRVRGYHLDLYQHVNNARYLEFLEEARWAYFEDAKILEAFLACGLSMIVVNININYRRGAVMNDTLSVQTGFKNVGNRSAVITQTIVLKGTDTVVADADITFVVVDPKTNKAVQLQGEIADLLQSLIDAA